MSADELHTRVMAHADLHPESRGLLLELLGELVLARAKAAKCIGGARCPAGRPHSYHWAEAGHRLCVEEADR